jgi:WD40 repeat protein
MTQESRDKTSEEEQQTGEAPQVYAVQKDLTGWRFSRRNLMASAGVAAAAALAGAAAGCGPASPATPTPSPEEKARAEACQDIRAHSQGVLALAVSPDGALLASGSSDKTIKLWSLPEGKLLRTLEGHAGWVESLAVSPDGALLASGDLGGTIKLWSLPEGALVSCLMDLAANESDIKGITYTGETITGQTVEYTLPCGAPIPPGAVCTCNCVAGGYVPCGCVVDTAPRGGTHYWYPC